MNNKTALKLLITLEIIYVIFSTAFSLIYCNNLFNGEINRSIIRFISLIIYLYFFKTINKNNSKSHINITNVLFISLSLVLLMLYPLLFQKSNFSGLLSFIWFASSFIVGFREEIFYRGFVQYNINKSKGIILSIILTSLIFTLYHVIFFIWGQWITLVQIFIWSLVIGIIYYKTKSIVFVSLIHGVYDAIPFVTPFTQIKLPNLYGLLFLVLAFFALIPICIRKKT